MALFRLDMHPVSHMYPLKGGTGYDTVLFVCTLVPASLVAVVAAAMRLRRNALADAVAALGGGLAAVLALDLYLHRHGGACTINRPCAQQ